jgi:2-dehydro-3-deoxy-D-arabinonate dehydratase
MKLARFAQLSGETGIGCVDEHGLRPLDLSHGNYVSLADLLEEDDPLSVAEILVDRTGDPLAWDQVRLLPPVDAQEIWAAGVTYRRSKAARMEESETAASCYDRVYVSERPELFLKATPHRVSGHGQPLRIRQDSNWNVPEPELTLVLNSRAALVGFTVGNDMSSRDIEGDNPLYLPQAKVYNQSAGVGPWVTLVGSMPHLQSIGIELVVRRGGEEAFRGATDTSCLARSFDELIEWLVRDNSFPNGAMLMTGTGIVPDSDFTLQPGDIVDITIDGIGTLSNPVIQG